MPGIGVRSDLINITLNQMKKVKFTKKKLIISGNVFELYEYDELVRITPLPQSRSNVHLASKETKDQKERQKSSLYRSKKRLKRLINSNAGFHTKDSGQPFPPVFITFTFKENILDLNKANYRFTKFIQRLNHSLSGQKKSFLKYIVAVEFQKRGAVHYHAVFFNLPYRKKMKQLVQDTWSEGFVKVETVKSGVRDIGNYLTKYMTKEQSDPRLSGKKCYFSSRNLFKPAVIKDPDKIGVIMGVIDQSKKTYEKRVDSPEHGPGYNYSVYNVENTDFVRSILDLFVKPGYFNGKL
jgi:hypothetical protein